MRPTPVALVRPDGGFVGPALPQGRTIQCMRAVLADYRWVFASQPPGSTGSPLLRNSK